MTTGVAAPCGKSRAFGIFRCASRRTAARCGRTASPVPCRLPSARHPGSDREQAAPAICSRFRTITVGGDHERQSRRRVSRQGPRRSSGYSRSQDGGAGRPGHHARRHPQGRVDQHLRLGPAHGARPYHGARRPRARARDHRRGDGTRRRCRDAEEGRSRLGAVQRRLRPLPHLPRGPHRRLPHRQPGPCGRRLRLRRHGRMGRRAGTLRAGSLRGFQPVALPRQGAGHGEDPRSHHAERHPADRLPRRRFGEGGCRLHRVHRGRR